MKKFISLVLCLVMCVSVFTGTAVQVYALADAQSFFQVVDSGFADEEITYTIKLNPNQTKITGVILNVEFDSEALRVEEAGAAGSYNEDGDFVENVSGMYATGITHDNANIYALGYTSVSGYNVGSKGAEFFVIKFRAVSSDGDFEEVKFKCVEYTTDDGDNTNDINKTAGGVPQDFYTHEFLTLSMPSVTQVNSLETGLRVVWTESRGATSYKLYRRAESQTEWTELATISDGATEYIDETAAKGTEYYYTVSATNANGDTTPYDETGVVGFNFGTISEVNAVGVENGAKITWSALDGADSYEIFRKLSSSNEWSRNPIASIDADEPTEYIDETLVSGNSYVYRVRAVKGSYYADSAYESSPVKYLAKPEISVSNIFDGIQVSFDEVQGAQKYIVERKVSDGEFEFFAEINADEDLSKLDENVVEGTEYAYSVQAVAEDGCKSSVGFSTGIARLSTVNVKKVENKTNGIYISWEALSGVESYAVFYKLDSETRYNNISGIKTTDFTITGTDSGKTYNIFVCAEDETGFGGYKAILTKTFIATPVITSVSNINEGIRVIWETVAEAEKYNIYRAKKDSNDWSLIATSTETVYIDEISEAEHGICYKYTVSAVMGDSESAYNSNGLEGMYFGNVSSISATVISNGAVITWNTLEKATAYDVYRKNNDDEDWVFQTQVTKNTYTDTKMKSGIRYYYMVKARNGNSVSEMTASPAEARYIAVPSFSVKNAANGVKITITPVGGATIYVIEKKVNGAWKSIKELNEGETVFVDTDVEGDKTYSYRVYAKDLNTISAVSKVIEIVRMGSPKITSISNTIPGVALKWTPVDDAVKYEVYRKDSKQTEWECIADDVKKPEFTDGVVDNGEKYSYTINAVNEEGSTGYNKTGKSIRFVETPDMSKVTNAQKGVNIKWVAVKGATSYKVYRKAGSEKSWTQIGTSKTTSYTDTKNLVSGTSYRYSVKAVNGNDSGIDAGLSIKYLAVPTLKSVKNVAKGVQINWNTVKGATSYKVYRKAGNAKTWTQIGTSKTTTYTDSKSLTSGTIYKYAVRAVSGTTSDIHSTGLSVRYLAVPKLKTPENVGNGIQVKWNSVKGATSYKVYRKLGNAKSWTLVGTSKTTTYTDKGVKNANGKTYKYTVCAVNGSTLGAYNATGLSIKRLSNPALKSAVSSKAGITVKWGAVTGAQGYVVLRKTGKGSFQQIATVKGAKNVSYVDKKAKKGTTYTYTVRAYSGSVKSAYNNGISCKDRY